MKIGIYEKAINKKFDWDEKIKIAKEAGFDFIELSIDETDEKIKRLDWTDQEINDLKSKLENNKMYFNSMCLSAHRKYPFGSKNHQTREKALEIMRKAIDLAKKLNIRIIQLAGYDVYYEHSDETTKKLFIQGLKEANSYAQENSIMLAFEVMDTEFMGTIEKASFYVNIINSPWLQIYPDIGNLFQFSDNPTNEIISNKKNIVAYHIKDTLPSVHRDLELGQGNVDFDKILNSIKETNYNGPMLIEIWSKNNENESMKENIDFIRNNLNFLKKKIEGIW